MRQLALILPFVLAACASEEPSAAEKEAHDEAKIAAVEQAQEIPPTPISLEPIAYPDIEKHDLFGASCAFAPDGGGLGALVLAMEKGAYIKLDGKIERLAPDPGSPELPLGARGKYDGKRNSLILDLAEGEGEQEGMETVNFPARLVVRNERDQVVYEADGVAQCGS
jgi:hypothetical protein